MLPFRRYFSSLAEGTFRAPRGEPSCTRRDRTFAPALALVLISLLAGAGLPAAQASRPAAFTLTLSASPSPTDPLQISFSASAVTGTPTAYAWNFGDGQAFNGSGPAYADPVHRYNAPGAYVVVVTVFEGNQSATQSLPITVAPAPLRVVVSASNTSGAAPLTVRFSVTIAGGTGTFRSVLWSFGDGGSGVGTPISYSFTRAGQFLVLVNVTDSSGTSAIGRAWVNVTAGTPVGTSSGGFPTYLLVGSAVGATAVGVVVGLVVARLRDRRNASDDEPEEAEQMAPASPKPALELTAAEVVLPAPGPSPEELPVAPPAPEPLGTSTEEPGAATIPPEPEPAAPERPVVSPTALRLSQRIVVHLSQLGTLGSTEVAPPGFSQAGMSESLNVRQNALTNVLRRLVAAGVLTEEVRHVRGASRRLKVYRLTPRGEALARELRGLRAGRLMAAEE
jgi:DNA-binding MarR family transcriptional regulator